MEIIEPGRPRIWQAGYDYVAGDLVSYPDARGPIFRCVIGHTSQLGWEPPRAPALWDATDEQKIKGGQQA